MSNCKGLFKRKKIDNLAGEIADEYVKMSKQRVLLGRIAVKAGFGSVEEFYKKYEASKSSHNEYRKTLRKWEDKYGKKDAVKVENDPVKAVQINEEKAPEQRESLRDRLNKKKEIVNANKEHAIPQNKRDRGIGL